MARCSKCGAEYSKGPHTCGQAGIQTLLVERGEEGPSEESSSYEAGALIGQYRLRGLLGEGAIGRVYLAEHLELGRRVALKILRSEFAKNHSVVERFFGEARAVNQIHHENIVEITDFVRADESGRSYYIMELLDGMTLKQLIDNIKTIPIKRALSIARQICSALEAVHAKGIVHRDLKPENIFLSQKEGKDFVKLLDFGAAKLTRLHDEKIRHQTLAGSLVGTPRYMAPEQTFGGEVDQRADIYAIGLLLYEMLAGNTPFDGETTTEILMKHRNDQPPPAPKQIPEGVRALIDRCLQKAPEDRPQSMAEVIAALSPMIAPRRTRLPALIAGLAVVSFAGAVAAYSLPEEPAPTPPPPVVQVPKTDDVAITIRSQPLGADVFLDQAYVGLTPVTRRLPRSRDPVMYELKLEGYKSMIDTVRPTADSTVSVVLAELPAPAKPARTVAKRIKKKRLKVAPRKEQPEPKKEIGLGDMRDPDWDK